MFSQSSRLFRMAFVAVAALIATSVVALTVVLSHEDTAMAANTPWPSKPPAAPSATTPAPAAASSTPTSAPTTAQTSPVAENSPVTRAKATSKTPAVRAPLTYTVKEGDNLTVIAAWFKLHGYGDLYDRNRKTIGADPNLIRPGQQITISSAGATMSR